VEAGDARIAPPVAELCPCRATPTAMPEPATITVAAAAAAIQRLRFIVGGVS
jgi:hypothetical protein